MQKKVLCERIVALVAQTTDLTVEEIMSSKKRADIVDARYLAVYAMLQQGVTLYFVAEFMNMTQRNVYHIKEHFDSRKIYGNPALERYYNTLLRALKQF